MKFPRSISDSVTSYSIYSEQLSECPKGESNTKPDVDTNIINALKHQVERDNRFWQKLLDGSNRVEGDDKIFFCFLLVYIGHNRTAKMLHDNLQGLDGLLSKKEAELKKKLEAFIKNREGKKFGFHHKFLPTRNCRPAFVNGILDFRTFAMKIKQKQGSLRAYLDSFGTFDDLFNSVYEIQIKYLDKALHIFDFLETLYRARIFRKSQRKCI